MNTNKSFDYKFKVNFFLFSFSSLCLYFVMRLFWEWLLTALEEQNGNLAQVEVDEVTCFVCHIRSKVASNDAMPSRIVLLVEFLFDVGGNVLFNVVLFKCLCRTVHGILLHFLAHISILNHGLAFRRHFWLNYLLAFVPA